MAAGRQRLRARGFGSDGVDIYLAIVSVHRASSGNWRDDEQQTRFTLERRPDLARLLLPSELGCDVLLFRCRPAAAA